MNDYLTKTLTRIEANNPNCGIIVMGDLNKLRTSHINRQFKLKQLACEI
jgi:2-phospho-L-lactate guanylyltransferase (CobY/MobA/RfbA family)